ncbi:MULTISPECIES: isochorismate synthase [unclassified Pseudomonas]|uniref:isochorismate synthase n=1 Tax=unclassified Pseudomonas TaxID=196821 RepID=UPI00244973D4|nr:MULTISPECIES: isochorismate synthase [unclassified Pseudomonas]MDH0303277.1 isochorismate synthase [Pseudomonas sp. GD04091]MDH1985301.1 isochorismate synthase [Pseudomonas sp. GD03689]
MKPFTRLEEDLAGLTQVFEQARQRAAEQGTSVLASYALAVADIDLLALFCRVDRPGAEALFWRDAASDRTLFGWGLAAELNGTGEQRFASVDRQWRAWLDSAVSHGPQPPLLCGGFRFDDQVAPDSAWQGFGDASLWLMSLLLIREGEQCWLLCQQRIGATDSASRRGEQLIDDWNALMDRYLSPPASTPPAAHLRDQCLPRADWQDKIAQAVDALRDSSLQKVVLAREVVSTFSHTVSPGRTLARLASADPTAYLFAFRRQASCFVGASPERLVKLHDGQLQTLALAGTCRRDPDPRLDTQLAHALMDCEKNRHEHAVVVQIIQQALIPWTTQLHVPATPSIRRLSRVQHLSTVIEGRLRSRASLLQLVATLHPTPAVGGHERNQAMGYIRRCEGFDRGWYAAPLGWLDAQGNGEFIVGLRSALLQGEQARLYAGCGIVQSSEPASEYEETCIKLAGMRLALQV